MENSYRIEIKNHKIESTKDVYNYICDKYSINSKNSIILSEVGLLILQMSKSTFINIKKDSTYSCYINSIKLCDNNN